MGTVWLCIDETLHRQVAVKQVGTLPGESAEDTPRALREARLSAALNHKNAVAIYDVVQQDGSTWLVMEYVPSRTLSQLLATEGRLPPHRVAHIGAQVAAALENAHAQRIVHRDIKPSNILVGEDDLAKISDFGIARGHQDARLTQSGLVTGTPAFFSPELARGEEPSFASDVWALGITLFTATEGEPPYGRQSNPLAMLAAITQQPLPPPRHAGPLAEIFERMLDPDPGRRLTMAASLTALREIEQGGGAANSVPAGAMAATGPSAPEETGQTISIEDPVDVAYERTVTVPAVTDSGPSPRGQNSPPGTPPDRKGFPFGRLLMATLAFLALVGAGALLWNTIDPGTAADPANPGSADAADDIGTGSEGSPEKDARSPSTDEPGPDPQPDPVSPTAADPSEPSEPAQSEPPNADCYASDVHIDSERCRQAALTALSQDVFSGVPLQDCVADAGNFPQDWYNIACTAESDDDVRVYLHWWEDTFAANQNVTYVATLVGGSVEPFYVSENWDSQGTLYQGPVEGVGSFGYVSAYDSSPVSIGIRGPSRASVLAVVKGSDLPTDADVAGSVTDLKGE